jgi:hypothetical protein
VRINDVYESKGEEESRTHNFLQLSVLILSVNKILNDVECPSKDKREEQAKAGEINVALGA